MRATNLCFSSKDFLDRFSSGLSFTKLVFGGAELAEFGSKKIGVDGGTMGISEESIF